MTFTPCTPADLKRIQHYGRATYVPYYPHVWKEGGTDFYMEACFGTDTLREQLNDPNIVYYLPETTDHQVVGLLKLQLNRPVPDSNLQDALYLEKIYLMPDFFGKGYGQKIIEFVVELAKNLGREAVWLTVMKTGPEAAYLRAGFQRRGEVRYDFDLLKPEQRGGWVMVKRI
jgi:GNAT superfamily N-acetyltransferase